MGSLQILELILLGLEKGPEVIAAVRNSFANEAEPTIEDIVKRINLVAPAWEKEEDPGIAIEPDED